MRLLTRYSDPDGRFVVYLPNMDPAAGLQRAGYRAEPPFHVITSPAEITAKVEALRSSWLRTSVIALDSQIGRAHV